MGREHGCPGQPQLHQLQAHQAVVHVAKGRAGKLDRVDSQPLGRQTVEQRGDQLLWLLMPVNGAVHQVDAEDAQRFLLLEVLPVIQPRMNDDLGRFRPWLSLEPNPQPPM